MSTITETEACPFPELVAFCDKDGSSGVQTPFRSGTWWCGTDGKIVAFRRAPDGFDIGDGVIKAYPSIDRIMSVTPTMRTLPAEIPDAVSVFRPCGSCDGTGKEMGQEECEDCDGSGKCGHCGGDCPECDGDGVHETGRTGDACSDCSGTGKITVGRLPILLDGVGIAWCYLSRLMQMRATVAWVAITEGRQALRWKVGDLDGFVMPMSHDPDNPDVARACTVGNA